MKPADHQALGINREVKAIKKIFMKILNTFMDRQPLTGSKSQLDGQQPLGNGDNAEDYVGYGGQNTIL